MTYISYDPWRLKENARFDNNTDGEVDRIVNNSMSAFRLWRKSTHSARGQLLHNLGDKITEERQMHALTITSEMGKPVSQSIGEVEKCALLCHYYADRICEFASPERRDSGASESYVHYQPQGIILGIMPWNFPYWQALRFIIPVIAGGNVVLLKHASNVPLCSKNIEKLFLDAGFPEHICSNIFPDYNQTERLISHPSVRGISLTGSNNAGKKIARSAGFHLKKTVLELGGSDPVIIFPDADLDAAAEGSVYSRFQNCGQSCIAGKRIFVHSDVSGEFLTVFSAKVRNLKNGDPYLPETFIGPMVSDEALAELVRQLDETRSSGAILVTGGNRILPDRPLFEPSVVTGASDNSPLLAEEVFGPVVPVTEFTDTGEVIAMANNTIYGLGASVWTRDRQLAQEVALSIDSGTVAVNGYVRSDPALPFGGVKDSGYGRELSVEGFREFLNIKVISFFG